MKYNELKKQISSTPNYKINKKGKTFKEQFKLHLKMILIGSAGGLISYAFSCAFKRTWAEEIFDTISMIFIFGGVFMSMIHLLLEAPSYATYKLEKGIYFDRMKKNIEQSENYYDFYRLFYQN